MKNSNNKVIDDFGEEWHRFDQSSLSKEEHEDIFNAYFSIFDWDKLPEHAVGFDLGCGSGRWAVLVAPRVEHLHCIEPSSALEIAKRNLKSHKNCSFHSASVDAIPLDDESMDFAYSLGVLHHIPDTLSGMKSCVEKLKPGAPFLVYLYYRFDNKPFWYALLWRLTDYVRKIISKLPSTIKYVVTQLIALFIYWPFAKLALLLEALGFNVDNIPLSAHRRWSFYVMRTDALDRFGTTFEQRFTRKEIAEMMEVSGLQNISFSDKLPFWCAVGYKKSSAEPANKTGRID